ncbi:MAG: transposase, partial [Clostridiales bacterium]|nr:transposase [Clostridiales bacterium]
EEDERYDGYYGIVSSNKELTPQEIINIYQGLWKIEESFRVLKSNLEARPIYVSTESSIKGHFVICYLALVIQRYLEYLLKQQGISYSTELIQESIRSAMVSLIEGEEETEYYIKNEPKDTFQDILRALNKKDIPTFGKSTLIKL